LLLLSYIAYYSVVIGKNQWQLWAKRLSLCLEHHTGSVRVSGSNPLCSTISLPKNTYITALLLTVYDFGYFP